MKLTGNKDALLARIRGEVCACTCIGVQASRRRVGALSKALLLLLGALASTTYEFVLLTHRPGSFLWCSCTCRMVIFSASPTHVSLRYMNSSQPAPVALSKVSVASPVQAFFFPFFLSLNG